MNGVVFFAIMCSRKRLREEIPPQIWAHIAMFVRSQFGFALRPLTAGPSGGINLTRASAIATRVIYMSLFDAEYADFSQAPPLSVLVRGDQPAARRASGPRQQLARLRTAPENPSLQPEVDMVSRRPGPRAAPSVNAAHRERQETFDDAEEGRGGAPRPRSVRAPPASRFASAG